MKQSPSYFAIIGDPVSHSLSPAMHNAAFKSLKLPYAYGKIALAKRQLPSFFKGFAESGLLGINVTVPHKENVLKYLDRLSPEARLIGAVNTVQLSKGKLIGHNTDGAGYVKSLWSESKWKPSGKKIVILGAGGAARGIVTALSLAGAKEIIIANRTPKKASRLAQELRVKLKETKWLACSLEEADLLEAFERADLLVNTSSGGMQGNALPPLPLQALPKKALVADIVYRPAQTPLLKAAKAKKLKTQGGLGMLLHQGALAFEIWTGKKAPLAAMKRALNRALKDSASPR